MNKTRLFEYLSKQKLPLLLELLQSAFDEMSTKQRQRVFGEIYALMPTAAVQGEKLLKEVHKFYNESIAGKYYAPFNINSKNFMDIPEETEVWFECLGEFLKNSTILSERNDHATAVKCFELLYALIFKMEDGDEDIVFADELGSWMIPIDEKNAINAYLKSLALVSSAEEFVKAALPLISRDSYSSFAKKVYASAMWFANKEQKAFLLTEIKRQEIRTKPL